MYINKHDKLQYSKFNDYNLSFNKHFISGSLCLVRKESVIVYIQIIKISVPIYIDIYAEGCFPYVQQFKYTHNNFEDIINIWQQFYKQRIHKIYKYIFICTFPTINIQIQGVREQNKSACRRCDEDVIGGEISSPSACVIPLVQQSRTACQCPVSVHLVIGTDY